MGREAGHQALEAYTDSYDVRILVAHVGLGRIYLQEVLIVPSSKGL